MNNTETKEQARTALIEKRRKDGVIPEVREKIFALLDRSATRLLAFGGHHNDDYKLVELTRGVGQLALVLEMQPPRDERLARIAAYCVGWLENLGMMDALDRIHGERQRQANLYLAEPNRYLVRMDSHVADNRRKLRILMEEIGEVAEAIDLIEREEVAPSHLKKELVQVAAVCVAWLETRQDAGAHSSPPAARGRQDAGANQREGAGK